MIEVRDIKLALGGDLKTACAKKLRVPAGDVLEARLLRRSVDARKKPDVKIRFLYIQFIDQTSYTLPYYSARTVEVYFHSLEWK